MARKKTQRQLPAAYAQGGNIFPITPFRTQLNATSTTNVAQEVQLDLDFEEREVFDIMKLDVDLNFNVETTSAAFAEFFGNLALCMDPDKASTTDLNDETIYEGDSSFIWFRQFRAIRQGAAVEYGMYTENYQFDFVQPFTVARNLLWILDMNIITATEGEGVDMRAQLWGRRRNAPESEFMNIVYRERF